MAGSALKSLGEAANRSQNAPNRSRWTRPPRFRDREAEGSNPSPPTIFVFKTGDFKGRMQSAAHCRITISLTKKTEAA